MPLFNLRHFSSSGKEKSIDESKQTKDIKETLDGIKQGIHNANEQLHSKAEEQQVVRPFRHDSTLTLIKKFLVYKLMGSNLFINYSLAGLNFSYRVFGMRLTNKVVQNTSGEIFTGGVTIEDIKNDTKRLAERNINTLVGYTNEGLVNPTKDELDKFTDFILESIKQLTEG